MKIGDMIRRDRDMLGDPRRADSFLRPVCRVEGDAVFCADCEGGGYTIESSPWDWNCPQQPVKCKRCGGEGLEPVNA